MNTQRQPLITLVTDPFQVEAKLSPENACGGWDKKFKAAVEVQVRELNEDGFVVEARSLIQAVRDYFKPATYRASCEQLAQCIVNLVHGMVGKKAVGIKVQVFSLTGHIRMEWKAGDQVPELPFCVDRH
jgi:hypothetical protein